MAFLFTSESVSEGHPDKVSDQISDAILDEFLRRDSQSKVACETLCTTGLVVVAGEVRSDAYVDIQSVARRVIDRIGYNRSEYQFDAASCGILSAIHEQSSDINQGVVRDEAAEQGAGDQGIMFGYACNETREYMPATLILSHVIMKELAAIRREGVGFDCEEIFTGVRCVAAPIFDYTGNLVATIGCSVPTVRITEESSALLIREVIQTAAAISMSIGAPRREFMPTTRTMLHCPVRG